MEDLLPLAAIIITLAGGAWPVGILLGCFSCCNTCEAETGQYDAVTISSFIARCGGESSPQVAYSSTDIGTSPRNVFSFFARERGASMESCREQGFRVGFPEWEPGMFFIGSNNSDDGDAPGPTATVDLSFSMIGDPERSLVDPQYPKRAVHALRFSCFEFRNPVGYEGSYSLPFGGGRAYSTYISDDDMFAVSLGIMRCSASPVVALTVMVLPDQPSGSLADDDLIGAHFCNGLGVQNIFPPQPGQTAAENCAQLLGYPRDSRPLREMTEGCCPRRPLYFARYYYRSQGVFSYGPTCVERPSGIYQRSVVMPDYSELGFSGSMDMFGLNSWGGYFQITSTPTAEMTTSLGFPWSVDTYGGAWCYCNGGVLPPGNPNNAEIYSLLPYFACDFSVSFANP